MSCRPADVSDISSAVLFNELRNQSSIFKWTQLTTYLTIKVTTRRELICRAVYLLVWIKLGICHLLVFKTTRKCLGPETKMSGSTIRKENGKIGAKTVQISRKYSHLQFNWPQLNLQCCIRIAFDVRGECTVTGSDGPCSVSFRSARVWEGF